MGWCAQWESNPQSYPEAVLKTAVFAISTMRARGGQEMFAKPLPWPS